MTRAIINVGLFLFFVFSLLLVIIYGFALYEKITRPAFKNMNDRELIWFGLLALVFAILDFLILRRFVRTLRK
jgi:Co/Zn/Cd efflux system component